VSDFDQPIAKPWLCATGLGEVHSVTIARKLRYVVTVLDGVMRPTAVRMVRHCSLSAPEHKGLNQERRPLWLQVADLTWHFPAADQLQLKFSLMPGQYATSLLRECVQLQDKSIKIQA
jgi:hypothetical protein